MSEGRKLSWLEKGSWVAGIASFVFGIFAYFDGRPRDLEKLPAAGSSQIPPSQPPAEASNLVRTTESEVKANLPKFQAQYGDIQAPVLQPPTEAVNPTAANEGEMEADVSESQTQNSDLLAPPQRPAPKLPFLYKQRGRLSEGGVVYLRTPDSPTADNYGKQLEEKYRDQLLQNGLFSATMTTLPGALNEGKKIYNALENRGIPVTIDEFPDHKPTYVADYCCVLYYVPENHAFAAKLAEEFTKITGLNFVAEPGANPPKDPAMRFVVQCTPRQ